LTVSERDRHHMHCKAEEAMGSDAADTLMSYLPPVGWADVATKRDLDALEERMELRFQLVDQRFDAIDRRFEAMERRVDGLDQVFVTKDEMAAHVRTLILSFTALNLTFGGLALGVVQLLR
jgi:hypothetical protein